MTLLYGSDLVSGGWDALDNIYSGIGAGFFPTQQRQIIKSDIVESAGISGQTFRPTLTENQSMVESSWWSKQGWAGSPYQDELAVGVKRAEGKQTAETMGPKSDPIGETLSWALSQTSKVSTLYDELKSLWTPREVTKETPRAGYPEGRDVRHLNETIKKGSEVIKSGVSWAGGMIDQVKGLYNRAFGQTGKQPVFSIEHELEPGVKIGIGVIAAVVILVLLLRK